MKLITILSAIGIIGAVGGYEQSMFGFGGCLLRLAIFFALMVGSYQIDMAMTKARHRKKVRKCQS